MDAIKIKRHDKYWIHPKGYVFKIENRRELILPIDNSKYAPRVKIGNKHYNLVFLLAEYFCQEKYSHKARLKLRYKYKIIDGKIPLSSIKIIGYNAILSEDENKLILYKCKEKAVSANSRVMNISQIDDVDVYNALVRTGFTCFYCAQSLNPHTWELDHVEPLSKSGLNTANNVTASCKKCNRMKGSLHYIEFLNKCKKISDNLSDIIFENRKEAIQREVKAEN